MLTHGNSYLLHLFLKTAVKLRKEQEEAIRARLDTPYPKYSLSGEGGACGGRTPDTVVKVPYGIGKNVLNK